MGYIGVHGIEGLLRHKYSGVDRSYVAKYILQPFWSYCVNLFPLWIAPNVITAVGLSFILTSAFLSYVYSPLLDSPPPRWVNFAHGLLLFLYQTFDAIDGKQARRTNSTSPLGCDALVCAFETMAFGNSVMSGRHTIWFWILAAIPFYFATWEHFFTNTLILPEINGPTEGLLLIYMIHFFTSAVGAEWWIHGVRDSIKFVDHIPLIPNMPIYQFLIFFMMAVGVLPTIVYNIFNVHKVLASRKGNMTNALAMIFPFLGLVGGVFIWGWLSPSDVLATEPHLMLMGTGFAFGYLVGRLVLAHICDEPKGLKTGMCMSLLILPLAIGNAFSSRILDGVPCVSEHMMVGLYCFFTFSLWLHFAVGVTHEITSALGIKCFRITRKKA
ncbi:choline/ethanolaminephosphotransferase 1 isoform X2 [Amborella trichopoda]|uniref:choline/ethanolaminephosphotransferase 1 isoform X2 n=1 Tax=Amborella trichopoda TaxID=13333 RepID=UPI0005D2ED71|nr:choline/ethanolaminephosphotransferase 1 isoform X2 [Amborella trichopoda]|eukprot:XP_011623785.1 choline/ethanolaminephosphotransferase 1 isoform X2 [Amborella trichopoda]